jgi:predicted RNA-binding protein YlqC (UPF0109 family)
MDDLRKALEQLVREMVDEPATVTVEMNEVGTCSVFEIAVGDADRGKVIGKGGRTIDALRVIIDNACRRVGRRSVVEVVG